MVPACAFELYGERALAGVAAGDVEGSAAEDGDEQADSQASQEQMEAVMAAHNAFGERYKDQIVSGEALLETSSATTVRVAARLAR